MIELSKESLESFISEYPMYITWDGGSILEEIKFRNEPIDGKRQPLITYELSICLEKNYCHPTKIKNRTK